MSKLRNLRKTLGFAIRHPLNSNRRLQTVLDYFKWQITARTTPGPIIVPLVGDTSIIVQPQGHSTLLVHTGLYDYEDMLFLLHFLRKDDLFVDIGSNIGIYSILAAGAANVETIAFEPAPSTFKELCRNISLNSVEERVTAFNMALGTENGKISFTIGEGAQNHVSVENDIDDESIIEVNVGVLDKVLDKQIPTVIKIDVEGFETEVFNGAKRILGSNQPQAIIMELNGSGKRYGYNEDNLHRLILDYGFDTYRYDPISRSLKSLDRTINKESTNTLYLRNQEFCTNRVQNSKEYWIPHCNKSL